MEFFIPFVLGVFAAAVVIHFYSLAQLHSKLDSLIASAKAALAKDVAEVKTKL